MQAHAIRSRLVKYVIGKAFYCVVKRCLQYMPFGRHTIGCDVIKNKLRQKAKNLVGQYLESWIIVECVERS